MIVFISGSMSISVLDDCVTHKLDNIISNNYDIIIGDAHGVDKQVQQYLSQKAYNNITIYSSGNTRNNIGMWPEVHVSTTAKLGTRKFHTAKDLKMATVCHRGFMIWNAKSEGTHYITFYRCCA